MGLSCGVVLHGNIGSENRMEWGLIGDEVLDLRNALFPPNFSETFSYCLLLTAAVVRRKLQFGMATKTMKPSQGS